MWVPPWRKRWCHPPSISLARNSPETLTKIGSFSLGFVRDSHGTLAPYKPPPKPLANPPKTLTRSPPGCPQSPPLCRHCRRRVLQTPVNIDHLELSPLPHILCDVRAHPYDFYRGLFCPRSPCPCSTEAHRRSLDSSEVFATNQRVPVHRKTFIDFASTRCTQWYDSCIPNPSPPPHASTPTMMPPRILVTGVTPGTRADSVRSNGSRPSDLVLTREIRSIRRIGIGKWGAATSSRVSSQRQLSNGELRTNQRTTRHPRTSARGFLWFSLLFSPCASQTSPCD